VVPKSGNWNIVIDLGGHRDVAKYRIHYAPVTEAAASAN
jgi:hypothetical protein